MPSTAAAPQQPCRPPEIKAELMESFLQSKPAKRANSRDVPSIQVFRPQEVLFSISHKPAHKRAAEKKDIFIGEGLRIEGKRTSAGMYGVASRFAVFPLVGPLIRPSIKGMMAAEAIKDVKRKSAFRRIFRTADTSAISPEKAKAIPVAASMLRQA